MNKRGVSTLIAVVLLIVITVAATGIVWQIVIPLAKQSTETTEKCQAASLEINKKSFYNASLKEASILVSRGAPIVGTETVELVAIQIKITSNTGDSKTVKINASQTALPKINEDKLYSINLGGLTGSSFKVEVAPVVEVNEKDRLCQMSVKRSLVVVEEAETVIYYRKSVTVDNSLNPETLSDYQILITTDTSSLISEGKMRADCGDIRFRDVGTELSYWLESGCDSANTKIWVKVNEIPASSNKVIYMNYGSGEDSASNGDATFEFFDDFEGTSLDTNKWEITTGGDFISVSDSLLHFELRTYNQGYSRIKSISSLPAIPLKSESKIKIFSVGTDGCLIYGHHFYNAGPDPVLGVGWAEYGWFGHGDFYVYYDGSGHYAEYDVNPVPGNYTFMAYFNSSSIGLNIIGDINHSFSVSHSTTLAPFHLDIGGVRASQIDVNWVLIHKYTPLEPSIFVGVEEIG